MADEKKTEFVVTDRRRFAPEGELRTDAPVVEEEKPAAPPPAQAPPTPPAVHQKTEAQAAPEAEPAAESEEMPPPPTAEEQHEQDQAYKASGKKLEEMIEKRTGKVAGPVPEMTFEAVIESFYMSALIQLGLFRQEGQQTGVDLVGARQTIDSLALLQEKTKGNLNDKEQHLLQNVLFELRMLWIERTNAIANAPLPAGGPGIVGAPPPGGIKK